MYRWRSGARRRRPSTRMSSAAGSALTPISRIVWPLTETRPSSISFSAARREAIPAWESSFCSRTPVRSFTALLFDDRGPEADELQCLHRAGLGIQAGVRDEPAQQHLRPDAFQFEMIRQEDALGGRNDVVVMPVEQEYRRSRRRSELGRERRVVHTSLVEMRQKHRSQLADVPIVH